MRPVDDAALAAALADALAPIRSQLGDALLAIGTVAERVEKVASALERYEPILQAYLHPDASGPGAWAVRRQMRKAGVNGTS